MASDLASILLGGVLTLSGTFFVHAYQRHIERKRLCSALSVEIQLMEEWFFRAESMRGHFDKDARQTMDDFMTECENQGLEPETQLVMSHTSIIQASKDLLKTDIYDANRGKMGVLTSEQAAKTICFYNDMKEYHIYEEDIGDTGKSREDEFQDLKSAINGVLRMRKMQQQTLESLNQSIWEIYNPFYDVTYYPIQGGLFPDKDGAEYLRWEVSPRYPEEQSSSEETTH